MTISDQIAVAAKFNFGQVFFYFLQVNQQKRVGMVSTNNLLRTYSEQIYKPS